MISGSRSRCARRTCICWKSIVAGTAMQSFVRRYRVEDIVQGLNLIHGDIAFTSTGFKFGIWCARFRIRIESTPSVLEMFNRNRIRGWDDLEESVAIGSFSFVGFLLFRITFRLSGKIGKRYGSCACIRKCTDEQLWNHYACYHILFFIQEI